MECKCEDHKHHNHNSVKIKDELERRMKDWVNLVGSCKDLKSNITNYYSLIEPIVKYLETEHLNKTNHNVKAPSKMIS